MDWFRKVKATTWVLGKYRYEIQAFVCSFVSLDFAFMLSAQLDPHLARNQVKLKGVFNLPP